MLVQYFIVTRRLQFRIMPRCFLHPKKLLLGRALLFFSCLIDFSTSVIYHILISILSCDKNIEKKKGNVLLLRRSWVRLRQKSWFRIPRSVSYVAVLKIVRRQSWDPSAIIAYLLTRALRNQANKKKRTLGLI